MAGQHVSFHRLYDIILSIRSYHDIISINIHLRPSSRMYYTSSPANGSTYIFFIPRDRLLLLLTSSYPTLLRRHHHTSLPSSSSSKLMALIPIIRIDDAGRSISPRSVFLLAPHEGQPLIRRPHLMVVKLITFDDRHVTNHKA